MRRDPIDKYVRGHIDSISVKKIKPRFSYKRCVKCEMEYKKEEVYKCSWLDKKYSNYHHMYGCVNCFSSEGRFIKYLQQYRCLYTEESLKHCYIHGY